MVDGPHRSSSVLSSEEREDISRIAAAHGARNVRLFGSVVRGESKDSSDLDVLVEMTEGQGLFDLVALSADLEEVLGVALGTEKSISPYLRDRVWLRRSRSKDKRVYGSARAARDSRGHGSVGSSPVVPRLLFPPSHFAGVSCLTMQAIDVQTVVFREGEHYVAQCLDVDVSSFGNSEDDALANLREALELYFEDAPADSVAKVEGPEVRRLTLERA
jgi:predicted nucleotidyltransferase/predicted RNase H-like HicB family nuclease